MPDRLDMPDWKHPNTGAVMTWDPTSKTYVEAQDKHEDQPTQWSGAGQTLDPAIHSLKSKNPEQTGILASWTPSIGDEVSVRGNFGGGPQEGDVATVEDINTDMEPPRALLSLPARGGGQYKQWIPIPLLIPREDLEGTFEDHVPVDFQKGRQDTPQEATDMVRNAAATCPNCGGIVDPNGRCQNCNYVQFDPNDPSQQNMQDPTLGPFPERVPKLNYEKVDNSYPSLASAPESLMSDMRSFPESESSWEHDLREAAGPSLDSCPECAGPMHEGPHGAMCKLCGLKQPAATIAAEQKTAFLQFLAPLLMGGGEAAAGAAAAGAGEAAVAGGAAAGAEAGAGGLMGNVGKVMRGASTANGAKSIMDGVGGPDAKETIEGLVGDQPVAPIPMGQRSIGKVAGPQSNEGWQIEFVQKGESDNPEHDGTRGFQEEHSDAPEFLKDVNGDGGTKTEGDVPEHWLKEFEGFSDEQKDALKVLADHFPTIEIFASDDTKDGSQDETVQMVDAALEAAFPGYKDDSEPKEDHKDKKESSVNPHDMLEKVAARRPKMCPAHADLTDASLLEGKSLLGQFAPNNYGSNYCKSPDFDGKCNFKPAMTTQKYWDDKEEAAAQRKQERDQAAQAETEAQRAEELAGTTLDPAEHDVDFGDAETPSAEAPVAEVSEYAPGLSEAPSAIGQPVAASFVTSSVEVGTAVRRRTINPSANEPVGVVVELTTVHPSSPGRATVRFEDGHEESIPVVDLEPADGAGAEHPTMDHYTDPDTADAYNAMGDQMMGEGGENPYSYASAKTAEHDISGDHAEDADSYDFGHGAPAHQSDSAVADDGQHEAGLKDVEGHPLKEGAKYLMTSEDYSVPDKITIDKIAGSDITYTIHSGDMDFQDVMSVADIKTQKFAFKPVEGKPAEDSPEEMADDVPAPTIHQTEDDGGNLSDFKAASGGASRAKGCTCDKDLCECTPKEASSGKMRTCPECDGHTWTGDDLESGNWSRICSRCQGEGVVEDEDDQKEASYEMPGRAPAPDDHFMWSAEPAQKTAGKDYSRSELRSLIEEGEGKLARNFENLDLGDTHYNLDDNGTEDWIW